MCPIYEYLCTKCGHEMEAVQKMSEPPLVKCPVCNKKSLQKQISTGGFILKGEGFYKRSENSTLENGFSAKCGTQEEPLA